MVADQPNRTSFVVAPANLCLTCTPHLTGVKYRTLLQANNQHFSPVLSTNLSYQLVSRHTQSSPVKTRDRRWCTNTMNFTRQGVLTRCKNTRCRGQPLFDFPRTKLWY
jgi:hypothetical protein